MNEDIVNDINTLSMDLLERYNSLKWDIVKQKILYAASEAVDVGDMQLATILRHAHDEDLESFWHEMQRHNYNIELHMPPDTIKTNGNHFSFNFSGMKLVIWKKVMEI